MIMVIISRFMMVAFLLGSSLVAQERKFESLPSPINSKYNDFAPSLTADGKTMVFSSNRRGSVDIYITYKNNGKWTVPRALTALNSRYSDETPYISPNGSMILFASDRDGSFEMPRDASGRVRVSFDIYMSTRKGNSFSRPRKVPMVNTTDHEKAPSLSLDGKFIFFSRWKFGTMSGSRIYGAAIQKDGSMGQVLPLPAEINSGSAEFGFVPATDRNGYYFSAARKDTKGMWDIYFIPILGKSFGKVEKLPNAVNSTASDSYLTSNKNYIYFSSNRKGGLGGFDIYAYAMKQVLVVKVIDKKTRKPLETKLEMNTAGMPITNQRTNKKGIYEFAKKKPLERIRVSKEGYQAATIHKPIFKDDTLLVELEQKAKKQQWQVTVLDSKTKKPLQAQVTAKDSAKINTLQANEQGNAIFTTTDPAVISALSATLKGYKDYSNEQPKFEKHKITIYLEEQPRNIAFELRLVNKKTGQPVIGQATIHVGKKKIKWSADSGGRIALDVNSRGKVNAVSVAERGYLPYYKENPEFTEEGHIVYLEPVEKEKSFTLHNIQFDFNSARLKSRSKVFLKELSTYLKDNRSLRFRIIGHTDLNGSAEYNKKLSLRRAKAVKKYLVQSGVAARRFEVAGAGKSRPLVKKKSAKADALNRRTEFKVID